MISKNSLLVLVIFSNRKKIHKIITIFSNFLPFFSFIFLATNMSISCPLVFSFFIGLYQVTLFAKHPFDFFDSWACNFLGTHSNLLNLICNTRKAPNPYKHHIFSKISFLPKWFNKIHQDGWFNILKIYTTLSRIFQTLSRLN